MRKASATAIIMMLLVSPALLADQSDQRAAEQLHGALVSAKFSGGCVILVQMAKFQVDTKMPGGDEFLDRFVKTEAARLGFSVDQYLKQCADSARVYEYYDKLTAPEGRAE